MNDTYVHCVHFATDLLRRIGEAKRKRLSFRSRSEQTRTARIMAETSQIAQTFSEGDDTLLEAGEIATTESGNEADHKSESDIPYGREELLDSENESVHDEAHSSALANLTQRDRRLSGSGDPVISPNEIEMPELIRWIGTNSLYKLCAPPAPAVEPGHYAMVSQYVPPKREDEFLMLST